MNHKTDEYWGTLLLEMAHDAREDGDHRTAELLTGAAMQYFDEADRLETRWRKLEALLDGHETDRPPGATGHRRAA